MAHSFFELDRLWSMWSVWLVFCDCGCHSVYPFMEKDKRSMDASWWEIFIEWETGSCLMGRAMLSKSWIQFSIDGQAVFPPCYLTWGQTMVEVMKIIETSFRRSHAGTAALSASDPEAATVNPCLCWRLQCYMLQKYTSFLTTLFKSLTM